MSLHKLPRVTRDQKGVSLVEIMIAMVIGLILTAGIIQLFMGSKQTYRFHDALSRVQENARFAVEALNYDIRMAGNLGCTSYVQNITNTLNAPVDFKPGTGIQGWEATGTAPGNTFALPAANAAVVDAAGAGWATSGGAVLDVGTMSLPGSDVVRIWRGDNNPGTITGMSPGANTNFDTEPETSVELGEILLLSDCQNADLVQACNVSNIPTGKRIILSGGCDPGNDASERLSTQVGGQIVRLRSFIYFVGKRDNDPNNPPGLFRRPLGATGGSSAAAGAAEEVVEGVESMQVLYGVDTDNDRVVNQYVTANNVPDWNNVLSVQIALLMRATERGDDISGATTYVLNGSNADAAADGRLRQVFNTTIALRNRVP
ncbi:MAG: PilW family protein [Thiohalobacteraceae bacterium]